MSIQPCTTPSYPQPNWVRTAAGSTWQSLDDAQWDFLFDDQDVGLNVGSEWYRNGLPSASDKSLTASSTNEESAGLFKQLTGSVSRALKGSEGENSGTNGGTHFKCKIHVPFSFQTPRSGVPENQGAHEVLWYERFIQFTRSEADSLVLLRFAAVDYEATVWINGQYVGFHRGGHVPFSLDITPSLVPSESSQRLTIRVRDSPHDLTQPRGKQFWGPEPESIFYTPTSGIWQSVWLESIPSPFRIADSSGGTALVSNDIHSGSLKAVIVVQGRRHQTRSGRDTAQPCVEIEASLGGIVVATSDRVPLKSQIDTVQVQVGLKLSPLQMQDLPDQVRTNEAPLHNDLATWTEADKKSGKQPAWNAGVALWSPQYPTLYDVFIRLYNSTESDSTLLDEVRTSVGVRSLDWLPVSPGQSRGSFRLNTLPFFQSLFLDQGYWPETGMTPPDVSEGALALKRDIEMSKQMGFNGCRKHQKVEDPRFLYWADRLGYLVWGEMANAYDFSAEYRDRFDQEWKEAVLRDRSHACIVTWTPVNESWAYTSLKDHAEQRNHLRSIYWQTKCLDPTRPINDNCGWEHVLTDLTTFHDYADSEELGKTAASLEGGILGKKAGRDLFVPPIQAESTRPSYLADPGAQHVPGAPVICTEFGGVNIKAATKGKGDKDWGYTTASDPSDLLERIEKLMMGLVRGGHVCGFVYTQLADIEQEVNGLLTFDRKFKLDAAKLADVVKRVEQVYYQSL